MNDKKLLHYALKIIGFLILLSVPIYSPAKNIGVALIILGMSILTFSDLMVDTLPKRFLILEFCYVISLFILGLIYNDATIRLGLIILLIGGLWLIEKYYKVKQQNKEINK
ncbi:hypothetical protein [Desulforamulus aquiferis]|uniref:Uncharacterized protein n=1 Tax=Desulforamulus aquiferis TaxID=1397668 RepID=A0AAW7ZGG5_9FIRM|nr:hypothetical protein [Desulforamulus aquiferis]MDO7788792.1 hypothetical protein [Desulforamulus aquiferis]